MNKKLRGLGLAGAVLMAGGTLFATALPASAHDVGVEGPTSCGFFNLKACGAGGVQQSHTRIWARDLVADGTGYYIEYKLRSGAVGYVGDANGSASGDGSRVVTNTSNPVVQFKGCADDPIDVCTYGWVTA